MKNKHTAKQIISYFALSLFVIGCIVLGIYNYKNNKNFFTTPLSTIVSIFIAVFVSFYLVQRKNDQRRRREKIDNLLYKIQDIILDKDFLTIKSEDLVKHRSIANKIAYVRENADDSIMMYIKKIEETFQDFRDFYGNHYTDKEYMKKSTRELSSYISLIDDYCDKIHMIIM